jgi:hypothetical protein
LVEWTANPIGAYPTSLTGQRTVEDATIVEGVAVVLIPYPDASNEENWNRRRARVAREIFAEGKDRGINSGVLPLALVALRGNFIEWVDPFMVRRETGVERPAGMDFGFGARALREAHLLQFQHHLADAFDAQSDQPFNATSYFDALPPVGQFPAGMLDPEQLSQRFFPAGIEVEISFVPEDELPALIEESLLLPPIDLTDGVEALKGTGVIVLVPLRRADFNQRRASLPNWDAELPRLRPAFTQVQGQATPMQLLLAQPVRVPPVVAEPDPAEQAWRQLLRDSLQQPLLWYVRRRHLPIPSNVAGTPVSATNETVSSPRGLLRVLSEDVNLSERFRRMREVESPESNLLIRRLSDSRLVDRPAMLKSIVARAAGQEGEELRAETIVERLAPAMDAKLGEGLTALETQDSDLREILSRNEVAETGVLVDVDRVARDVAPERFDEFTVELKEAAKTPDTLSVRIIEMREKFARS